MAFLVVLEKIRLIISVESVLEYVPCQFSSEIIILDLIKKIISILNGFIIIVVLIDYTVNYTTKFVLFINTSVEVVYGCVLNQLQVFFSNI